MWSQIAFTEVWSAHQTCILRPEALFGKRVLKPFRFLKNFTELSTYTKIFNFQPPEQIETDRASGSEGRNMRTLHLVVMEYTHIYEDL